VAQISGKQLRDNTVTKAKTTTEIIAADGSRAFTADQSMGGFKLTSLGTPTAAADASTKGYVDAVAAGLDVKASVRLATAAALPANTAAGSGAGKTLTGDANGALSVDGVAVAVGDRVLVKNETPASDNGIYVVTATGDGSNPYVLTRATDADDSPDGEVTAGMFCIVLAGSTLAQTGWVLTTADPITVDTTLLTFSQFSSPATTSFAAPTTTVKSEATAAAEGVAATALRSDAQIQAATAAPSTTIKSEATAAAQGAASTLLRSDAQIQAATATPVAVGTANAQGSSSSLARADHVHDSPAPTSSNKNMTASTTTTDNDQATATTVASTPALDGHVAVLVNGVSVHVGDGTKVSVDCYFSGDGGVTARAISAIVAGDTLHWNGSVSGYQLAATDRIDLVYEV
jgi:hypothetical protein